VSRSVLVVGVGGLGSPAAIALARAGVETLGLADDDVVETSNLHRQILFEDGDVGKDKLDAAFAGLRRWAPESKSRIVLHRTRMLPENARELASQYDLVVEGSDNFATKFMVADACLIERVPVVHASAVRWHGTALAVSPRGQPCYRCLFEDIPHDAVQGCSEAGVVGPVVGVVAALQVDLALALLDGKDVAGTLVTFDGKANEHRRRAIPRRRDCDLCSLGRIETIDTARYVAAGASP
jgi:molybdopterin/thiamine biosynthesis adenylyltransferase